MHTPATRLHVKIYQRLTIYYYLQALELNSYFKALGASNLDEEHSSEEDLGKIVAVADLCFKVGLHQIITSTIHLCMPHFYFQEGNESEAEAVLNSIVSMLVLLPNEKAEALVTTFCQKLSKPISNKLGLVCLRV